MRKKQYLCTRKKMKKWIKMNSKMSFAERAKLSMELISKQPPITLEEARAQAQWLKKVSVSKKKKERIMNFELWILNWWWRAVMGVMGGNFWIMNFELVVASSDWLSERLRGCPKSFVSWGRFANRPYNVNKSDWLSE